MDSDDPLDINGPPGSLLGHVVSGVVAGATVETALYPIDTIKTRMQVARVAAGGGYHGSVNMWRHLYKGLGGNLVGVVPSCALFFAVYEPAKRYLSRRDDDQERGGSVGAHLLAAASAGLASSLIRVPTEVVKSRLQTGQFVRPRDALWHIATREGVFAGLFAGFGSFLLRDLPFDAIEFASYEQMKLRWVAWMNTHGENDGEKIRQLRRHETAVIGGCAGVFTGAVTTPLDVVKTRLMTQGNASSSGGVRYRGVVDCVVRMVAEEGWRSLFKGVGPRVTWIGVGGGVFFFALEAAQSVCVPFFSSRSGF